MRDTQDTVDTSGDLDDIFRNLANEVDQSEKNRASRSGGYGNVNYEVVKYSGLHRPETGKPVPPKIFRILGKNPDFNLNGIRNMKRGPNDARIVRVASVINDKGSLIRLNLPLQGHDDNHILWRIINKVLEGDWVKSLDLKTGKDKWTMVPIHAKKYPDMVGRILYSNLPEESPQRKFLPGKGWSGKEFFVCNAIDREMKAWHDANKHTVVISKDVNYVKSEKEEGKIIEYAEPGVPASGFVTSLSEIMATYGFWENFDYGMSRTGTKDAPWYRIFNASKNPEIIKDPVLRAFVYEGRGLTEEEQAYAQYDFDKLFKISSANKILSNFKQYLAVVDANLGTKFIDELTKLAAEEKKQWEANREEAGGEEEEDPASESKVVAEMDETVTAPAKVSETRHDVDLKYQMKGWDLLTPSDKEAIDSASKSGDGWEITYRTGVRAKSLCLKCDTQIPVSFKHCPVCGTDQEADGVVF